MDQSQLYMYDEYDDIEHITFCYFILGTVFPAIWGFFFLTFSYEDEGILIPLSQQQEQTCFYLTGWGRMVAGVLFGIALFYVFLTFYSFYARGEGDLFSSQFYQENPKYAKVVKFEENYWRIIIVFSILTLFASFAIMDSFYGNESMLNCGNLFKLAELFFYIIAGFFSLIAVFCVIIFATDKQPKDSDAERVSQQQLPRYAHPYHSIEDMF